MRLALVVVAVALLAAPAASPTGSATGTTIGLRGSAQSIAADGSRVAIRTYLKNCASGAVWQPATNKVVRFAGARGCTPDIEFDSLTLAGSRVAWVDFDTGNHAYCQGPFTATISSPKAKNLGTCPDEPDNEDLYWDFDGDGPLLVARSYTLCEADCEPDYSRIYDDAPTLYRVGASATKFADLKDDTKLLDVSASRILLLERPGTLVLYSAAGKRGLAIQAGAGTGGFSGGDVVGVKERTKLTVYDGKIGSVKTAWTLQGNAKFRDADAGLVAYVSSTVFGTSLRVLRLADGRDRVVAKLKGFVDLDLEPTGLFYAWNEAKGEKPGRVTFVPMTEIQKALR
jgi:hypothetical protein